MDDNKSKELPTNSNMVGYCVDLKNLTVTSENANESLESKTPVPSQSQKPFSSKLFSTDDSTSASASKNVEVMNQKKVSFPSPGSLTEVYIVTPDPGKSMRGLIPTFDPTNPEEVPIYERKSEMTRNTIPINTTTSKPINFDFNLSELYQKRVKKSERRKKLASEPNEE